MGNGVAVWVGFAGCNIGVGGWLFGTGSFCSGMGLGWII